MKNAKSPAPRVDLALVAHEISESLKSLLAQYDASLVLVRERRGAATLQVQFPGDDVAITLICAAKPGAYQFVAIGDQLPAEVTTPPWLDRDAWARWEAYRAEIGKPLTSRTRKAQLKLLEDQHRMGLSQAASIDQSIRHGWVGLFPAKSAQRIDTGRCAVDAFVKGEP